MDPNSQLDDEVAQMTDTTLANEPFTQMDETLRPLRVVVEGLREVAGTTSTPSPEFEVRLRRAVDQAWDVRQREQNPSQPATETRLRSVSSQWWMSPVSRTLAFAAALVLALVAILLLSVPEQNGEGLPGTAISVGAPEGIILVLALALIAGAVMYYWRGKR